MEKALEKKINLPKYDEMTPYLAPDGVTLYFSSNRPGGFGEHDLYISYNKNGNWTRPKNLGNGINTAGWEMAPTLTPDGNYLLFTRRKAMITTEPAQIYWVSAKILNRYR